MPDKTTVPQPSYWERIRTLKEAADLRQVAAHLGLRQEGKHYFCPKCQTSDDPGLPEVQKPELAILDRVFLCHRCGTGGDALTLIRLVQGGGFQGTLEYLEQIIQAQKTESLSVPGVRTESRWKSFPQETLPASSVTTQPDAEQDKTSSPSSLPQQPVEHAEGPDATDQPAQRPIPPTVADEIVAPTAETEPHSSLFSDRFFAELGNVEPAQQQHEQDLPSPQISDDKNSDLQQIPLEQTTGERQADGLNESGAGADESPADTPIPASSEQRCEAYAAFLAGCWPLESARFVVSWLEERGLNVETATRLGIRLCGASYADLMERIEKELGSETLIDAGLLTENPDRTGYLPAFWPYFKHSLAFLVIPYLREGKPIYLKALPPIDRKRAEELQLPPMISMGIPLPGLYNCDALAGVKGERILFCERETDVLAAESNGFSAVGIPGWAHFKPEWVHLFEGIEVFLVLDEDEVALDGTRRIARFFQEAGMPQPKEIRLPAGCDLKDYLSA